MSRGGPRWLASLVLFPDVDVLDFAGPWEVFGTRDERYVCDGKVWTSAGVSAGIDMAPAIVGALQGDETGRRIQHGIEYDPAPAFPVWMAAPSEAAS